ncbi:MAG TPA: hypothetical protein VK338_01600 [Candidatus Nitrosocosmicus sp.]|nr:hypothetical protein [Candidatus Nitrosocosmicus sp.]
MPANPELVTFDPNQFYKRVNTIYHSIEKRFNQQNIDPNKFIDYDLEFVDGRSISISRPKNVEFRDKPFGKNVVNFYALLMPIDERDELTAQPDDDGVKKVIIGVAHLQKRFSLHHTHTSESSVVGIIYLDENGAETDGFLDDIPNTKQNLMELMKTQVSK